MEPAIQKDANGQYRVRNKMGWVGPFNGEEIAYITTEDKKRGIRWTEMRLLRTPDHPTVRWVFQSIGRTLVYHQPPDVGDCWQGTPITVGNLEKELDDSKRDEVASCPNCNPPALDDLPTTAIVRAEYDIFKVYRCTSPEQLFVSIVDASPKDKKRPSEPVTGSAFSLVNGPGLRLLKEAALQDSEIAQAMNAVLPL